ncbi:MAG: hypothetical protein RL367_2833 [Pseudomonadota bacterium]|jgi:mRNA interferase MazF
MVIQQGDVWWAELDEPSRSVAGYRRPVIVIQCDSVNQSRLGTTICVPLTSNLGWKMVRHNLHLPAATTGLPKDSVAQMSLIFAVNKAQLVERVGQIPARQLARLFECLDIVLGRSTGTA